MCRLAVLGFLLANICAALPAKAPPNTFTNPLRNTGPDPYIVFNDHHYYLTTTTGRNLTIWKSETLGGLKTAAPHVVWTPAPNEPYSVHVWAPELHQIDHRWYLYFAADNGDNASHRNWVLENPSADPTQGQWTFKGELTDPSNRWAIDPSVFENHRHWYAVWSGWPADKNGTQNIYIARLKNPWTIQGSRVLLSTPNYAWEEQGPVHVNEGPEILQHKGKIFLVFSASHCSTDQYGLGMLTASTSSNLLDPGSWHKALDNVFHGLAAAHAYGTGHNGFFKSPDGKQDWMVYHANPDPNEGCGDTRSTRAEPFTWNADGTPDFGQPTALGVPMAEPSRAAAH